MGFNVDVILLLLLPGAPPPIELPPLMLLEAEPPPAAEELEEELLLEPPTLETIGTETPSPKRFLSFPLLAPRVLEVASVAKVEGSEARRSSRRCTAEKGGGRERERERYDQV